MKKVPLPAARNPFEYGRELDAGELVDRREELETISRSIINTGKLFLIGPRRYGKTSLLATAETQAERAGTVVLRFDAERYPTLDALAQALLTAAGRRLTTTAEKTGDMLKRFASALLPSITYDVEKAEVSVSLGVREKPGAKAVPILVDVLDTIERMAEETERHVTVIIDEFQAVVAEKGNKAERQIRATVQKHRHVSYIFAGSATKLLADMTGHSGRPFYNLGARLFLHAIPREEFKAFLHHGFAGAGFTAPDDAIDRILDAAEEVPYSVQRLAHECWEETRVSSDATLTLARVDATLDRVCEQEGPGYTQMWTPLTEAQKKALIAVVEEGGAKLMSLAVAQKTRVAQTTIKSALASLEKSGLVRQEGEKGLVHYRLQDPLFGRWLEFVGQAKRRVL
ncbi:MAG: AAA family ATPase [bacterium]